MTFFSNEHNRWLAWKIKHGLATRGHVGGKMHPRGLFAGLLYRFYYRKHDTAPEGPQVFKQSVGGKVGSAGTMNGE